MTESHITAQASLGDAAVAAWSARRSKLGPNLEPRTAFVLHTADRGATWTELPFIRDAWGCLRYPGFPVWPPEYVASVEMGSGTIVITFRDEEVVYEPGGESLWKATLSPRGVWKIRRIRRMQYGISGDDSDPPPAVPLQLPAGFVEPDAAAIERATRRAAAYFPMEVPGWLWWIPGGAAGIVFGAYGFIAAAAFLGANFVGLPLIWFLLDRRRQRQSAINRKM